MVEATFSTVMTAVRVMSKLGGDVIKAYYLLGTGCGNSMVSTSAIGVRRPSAEPPSGVVLGEAFLFSDECCEGAFEFNENLESRDVFPVD